MNVKKIAALANLPITDTELSTYDSQLNSILGYVDQLQKVNTVQVEDTAQVTGLKNISQADQLDQFPPLVDGYLKVKAIFETND